MTIFIDAELVAAELAHAQVKIEVSVNDYQVYELGTKRYNVKAQAAFDKWYIYFYTILINNNGRQKTPA